MSIERQLQAVKNKADLHRWTDTLSDDSVGVLLIEGENGGIKWYEYGDIDLKTTTWILSLTQSHLNSLVLGGER